MINILFYIGVAAVSLSIAIVFVKLDSWLDNRIAMYHMQEKTLSQTNWFLKYELYRKGVKGNATETGNIQEN